MWKTCECFHKEAPIFIVTTLLKLPLWGLKSSLPPLESLLLRLISLGLLPVSQVFGNCLMFESFFVPNLWLLTFPFASFSPAQDPRLQSSTFFSIPDSLPAQNRLQCIQSPNSFSNSICELQLLDGSSLFGCPTDANLYPRSFNKTLSIDWVPERGLPRRSSHPGFLK